MLETPNISANAKNGTMAQYGNDANLWVEFSLEPVHMEFMSEQAGHPVYEDMEFVTIIMPGNNKSTNKERVTKLHKERFPNQYAQFQAKNEQVTEGMPLTEWPVITKAQALNLKGVKIYTVEQLAAIPDTGLDALGLGGRTLREKAHSYLARAVDASEITKIYAKIEQLEADNRILREQALEIAKDKNETLKLKKG